MTGPVDQAPAADANARHASETRIAMIGYKMALALIAAVEEDPDITYGEVLEALSSKVYTYGQHFRRNESAAVALPPPVDPYKALLTWTPQIDVNGAVHKWSVNGDGFNTTLLQPGDNLRVTLPDGRTVDATAMSGSNGIEILVPAGGRVEPKPPADTSWPVT